MNDDLPGGVDSIHPAEYASVDVQSSLLHKGWDTRVSGEFENFGLTVHRDGPNLSFAAGTMLLGQQDGDCVSIYFDIDPEEARAFAESVMAAAEKAERRREELPRKRQKKPSLVRRLLGGGDG